MKNKIHETEWAKCFKKEDPDCYNTAINYATNPETQYEIVKTDETGNPVYAICVCGTGFWMDAKTHRKDTIKLCKKMGWKYK